MKTINFKLSSGIEIELSKKDMEGLKPIIDSAIANLDVNLYERLKKSESKIITETLGKMNDLELIEFARIHDAQTVMNMLHLDSFSKKIYSELFKRAGIGFRQVSHLSFKQRNYLKELGLKSRNEKPL